MSRDSDHVGFRVSIAILALSTLTVLGTLGYRFVEGASWFDALYMTVITLSTVGFGEVIPLSTAGRAFTLGLIFCGVGTAAYIAASMMQLLATDVLAKLIPGSSMQKQIDRLTDHIIVCGYGRFGQVVVDELTRSDVALVIVERDVERQAQLAQRGLPFVIGNATSDEVLERVGVVRARAIVAATGSDPDNVFITLAAREHRADLRVHARGETAEAVRRLKQAGADYVMSAYQMGGLSLAASIMRPSVAQFLEIARPRGGHEVDIEEIRVADGSPLCRQTLRAIEQRHPRSRVVALVRRERVELVPDPQQQLEPGDVIVMIGERSSLEALATHATR